MNHAGRRIRPVLQQRAYPLFGLVTLCFVLLLGRHAGAFERQWHLGGGLGAATANHYRLGPAANAYAAYGLSDVFDVRLELAASQNATSQRGDPFLYGAKAALAYKIDVIQWIPYLALAGGYLGASRPVRPLAKGQPTAGFVAGLDYAVSRSFGLGLALSYDYAFHPGAYYANGFLRAEYTFGF
jgi:hypothetical protein